MTTNSPLEEGKGINEIIKAVPAPVRSSLFVTLLYTVQPMMPLRLVNMYREPLIQFPGELMIRVVSFR